MEELIKVIVSSALNQNYIYILPHSLTFPKRNLWHLQPKRPHLMRVHIHKAEALGPRSLSLHQADISFIKVSKSIQSFQDRLHRGCGKNVLNDHRWGDKEKKILRKTRANNFMSKTDQLKSHFSSHGLNWAATTWNSNTKFRTFQTQFPQTQPRSDLDVTVKTSSRMFRPVVFY